MDFAAWAEAQGFDVAALTPAQKRALQAAWRAESRGDGEPTPAPVPAVDPLAESRARDAKEARRLADIKAVCGDDGETVEAAILGGWDAPRARDATELKRLRASRAVVPQSTSAPVGTLPHGINSNDVLAAALAQSIGSPKIEKRHKADALQVAHERFGGRLTLSQLLIIGAQANGYQPGAGERVNSGNLREVLSYAFPQRRADTSTVSLSGILGTSAYKELLTGYMEVDQTWREIAAVKSVQDFKQMTSYRMLDGMVYEKVGPNGKIKHGTVDSESYTRQVNTYAKMFALTRRDLINDDLGAFDDIRNRLGRGAAQSFNDVFWTAYLAADSTNWTAARTNYISGSTTTLLADGVGLALGIKAFRQMVSPSADASKRIGGDAEILLVPPELEGNAQKLFVNENLATTSAVLSGNIYRAKYRPVVSAWLSDSTVTNYSTTAWWLLRNPGMLSAMMASFLNGQQTPIVESADADFDTLGIVFRGYHDFGCDFAEYLSGVKSKGAA